MSLQVQSSLDLLHPILKETCGKIQTEVITQGRVKQLFDYEDGKLIYKISGHGVFKGCIAGCINKRTGRYVINIDGKKYLLHRVIFLWHHGYMSEFLIDHEDRNPLNNRIDNLREVSNQCNLRNMNLNKNNKTGVTGVRWAKLVNKWNSFIRVDSKSYNLGHFALFEDAVRARHKKEVELNWEGCNKTSTSYLFLKERGLI